MCLSERRNAIRFLRAQVPECSWRRQMERQCGNEKIEERERLEQAAQNLMLEIGLSEMTPEVLRLEAGLSEDVFGEVFDSLEETSTPALQHLLLQFEEEAASRPTMDEQIEVFLSKSIDLTEKNGLNFMRSWLLDSLNREQTYGMSIVFTFWDILGRILERAIEEGVLTDEAPVDRLVNAVSAEFFGTMFCWCIMKGRDIDPGRTIRNYCRRDLPGLLEKYRVRPS